jgi:TrkA-C domain
MIAIITLLIVLTFSLLITKIATIALTYTGLSREISRFQARSAFTGVGYTTAESEKIVNHPVRRRIMLILMLAGNVGIVTAVSTLVMTFIKLEGSGSPIFKLLLLLAGLLILLGIASIKWVDLKVSRAIEWALRRYTSLDIRDYAGLLHMAGEYKVAELYVKTNDWLADKKLQELDLAGEGLLILGITRKNGTYLGAPSGATGIFAADNLVVYGRTSAIEELDERRKGSIGDKKHADAIAEHAEIMEGEKRTDPEAQQ